MIWAVFCIDGSGEGFNQPCPDWASAVATCRGFIEVVNPKDSGLTFLRELDMIQPDHPFHATDGVYRFAVETI